MQQENVNVMIICNDHKAAKAKSTWCDNLGIGKASDEKWYLLLLDMDNI